MLRVNDNKIGNTGAQALANALNGNVSSQQELGIEKPKLTQIVIEQNDITGLVKVNLLNAVAAANLEINTQYYCSVNIKITDQTAINTIPQSNTKTLILHPYGRDMKSDAFSIIKNLMDYPEISTLVISKIDYLSITNLYQVLPRTGITKLIISHLHNPDDHIYNIQQLANILPETAITNLDLRAIVDDYSAEVLAAALPGSKLTTLSLCYTPVGDVGARALATALLDPNTKLINLNLQNCKITHNGGLTLITAWKQYLDQVVANDPEGQGITTYNMNLIDNELFISLNDEGTRNILQLIGDNPYLVKHINFINDFGSSRSEKIHSYIRDFLQICEFSTAENDEQLNRIDSLIDEFTRYLDTTLDQAFADYPLIGDHTDYK